MKIAIIGAGISGLSCAGALAKAGHDVALFDKGRGPGGRMSTRRVDTAAGQASFDHGAQYFTVCDAEFEDAVSDWAAAGVAGRWVEADTDAWVGVPSMNAVLKHLVSYHDVTWSFLVKALIRHDDKWQVIGEQGSRNDFDAVVVAVPAEQAASILTLHDFEMARAALLARSQPGWTAMFSFAAPVPGKGNILRNLGPIACAARNNSKPGRAPLECWVVQANDSWSARQLEEAPADVAQALRLAFEEAIAAPLPELVYSTAHRWRYALPSGTGLGCLWNADLQLGACGDWLLGPRVECAWLSGKQLGVRMVKSLTGIMAKAR